MYEIKTEIDIESTSEQVWSILTDFPAQSSWNPFIRSIEGPLQRGARLTVSIQPAGAKPMTFRPTVLVATPNVELRWLGHLLFRGVFDGEHYFQIARSTPGRVRFVQGEKFSGLLVSLAKATLESGTRAGFIAMNQALKTRAEHALSQ
jgi:hypothetical protein